MRLEIAPSLTALGTDKPLLPRRPESVLIIGDPVSPSQEFPALGYAAKEIETIEASFPAAEKKKFTGAMARPGVYRTAGAGTFFLAALQRACGGEQRESARFGDYSLAGR